MSDKTYKIKPLMWERDADENAYVAWAPFDISLHVYLNDKDDRKDWEWHLVWNDRERSDTVTVMGEEDTIDDARLAAQSAYRRLIEQALEESP